MINPVNSNFKLRITKLNVQTVNSALNVPCDVEEGEVLSCPSCGLELEVKKVNNGGGCVNLQELIIEGEDWGE